MIIVMGTSSLKSNRAVQTFRLPTKSWTSSHIVVYLLMYLSEKSSFKSTPDSFLNNISSIK